MSEPPNPTETFQNRIVSAITDAAADDVHPAIVHTVLHGMALDVLASIKRMNQQPSPGAPASGTARPPESAIPNPQSAIP